MTGERTSGGQKGHSACLWGGMRAVPWRNTQRKNLSRRQNQPDSVTDSVWRARGGDVSQAAARTVASRLEQEGAFLESETRFGQKDQRFSLRYLFFWCPWDFEGNWNMWPWCWGGVSGLDIQLKVTDRKVTLSMYENKWNRLVGVYWKPKWAQEHNSGTFTTQKPSRGREKIHCGVMPREIRGKKSIMDYQRKKSRRRLGTLRNKRQWQVLCETPHRLKHRILGTVDIQSFICWV